MEDKLFPKFERDAHNERLLKIRAANPFAYGAYPQAVRDAAEDYERRKEAAPRPTEKWRILCVDDNEQSLSIRKVLLETRGYRVLTCATGEEALERFKKGGVDLVLTDLIMPGLDGTRLIEQIKGLSPQTPAILLSGKVRIYDRDTRADVFLPKGMYAPAELLERIRLLLVRKRGPKRTQSRTPRIPTQIGVA